MTTGFFDGIIMDSFRTLTNRHAKEVLCMGETSCVVFIEDEAYIFQGEGKLFLPAEMAGHPMMLSNVNGTKVMMNSGITNPIGRAAMRSSILGMIEEFRKDGILIFQRSDQRIKKTLGHIKESTVVLLL
jgi:hypothetical protein